MIEYLPSQVESVESIRVSPYCSMFGCSETETIAKGVIHWLASNGDRWDIPLPSLDLFGTKWEQAHGHTTGGDPIECDFMQQYVTDGRVNDAFRQISNRYWGGRLRPDVMQKLFPDILWK